MFIRLCNVGDAFLVTWKVPEQFCKQSIGGALTGEVLPSEATRNLFDKALYAFLRFTILIREHNTFISTFSKPTNNRLQLRMGNYKCALGMGLHVGLGYEGGIGTKSKIDATYISEHVNHVEFLESSTKSYKLTVLMSHFFKDNLSTKVQLMCRQVDTQQVGGTNNAAAAAAGTTTTTTTDSSSTRNKDDGITFHLWTYDVLQPDQEKQMRDSKKRSNKLASNLGGRRLESAGNGVNHNNKIFGMMGINTEVRTPVLETIIPRIGTKIDSDSNSSVTISETNFIDHVWKSDSKVKGLRDCIDHQGMMESWESCMDLLQNQEWDMCLEGLFSFRATFKRSNCGCDDGPTDFLINKVQGILIENERTKGEATLAALTEEEEAEEEEEVSTKFDT
jgi:hypothetical protein